MKTIIKSNDIVYISITGLNRAILTLYNIKYYVLDEEMSITEGNITAIPVRILVDENDFIVSKNHNGC